MDHKYLAHFILFTVFSSYFLPSMPVGNAFALRLDDVVILFFLPLLILFKKKIFIPFKSIYFLLAVFCSFLSLAFGYLFLDVVPDVRDLFEIIRLSKPLILIMAFNVFDLKVLFVGVGGYLNWMTYYYLFLSVMQYFNILGFAGLTGKLYSTEMHTESMISIQRIVLTGTDPNIGAAIASMFLIYSFFNMIIYKKVQYYFTTISMFIVLLMTSSRTMLVANLCVLVLMTLMSKVIKLQYKIIILLFFSALLYYLVSYFEYITIGFQLFYNGENASMLKRFSNWEESIAIFFESPVFGWGPAKGEMDTVVDGEYFLLLRRYGMLGFFSIIVAVFSIPFWHKVSQVPDELIPLSFTMRFYTLVIGFAMITNSFYSGYQLMIPYVFVCMILYLASKKGYK